jgi:hypothetical protein
MRPASALLFVTAAVALAACQSTPSDSTKPAATMSGMTMAPATAPAAVAAKPTPPANLSPLVDQVTPGDDAGERAHNQQGDNTDTGDWTDRTYRDSPNGWFSWDLKVDPNLPNELDVTYAGVDQRTFQILIDGQNFSRTRQTGSDQDFYDQKFPIPLEVTKGKQKITVRFQSVNNGYAGGVFGVKIMRVLPAK